MLYAYVLRDGALQRNEPAPGAPPPADALWIDLFAPTPEEDALVEATVRASVPTREEMVEIEPSSRLYLEDGARYMTASVLCNVVAGQPKLSAVTFILTRSTLVTVRYDDPTPFSMFSARACKANGVTPPKTPEGVMLGLFDAIVDRLADILEHVGADVDELSAIVFERAGAQAYRKPYQELLKMIGRKGDLVSKTRESLVTLQRVANYLVAEIEGVKPAKETKAQLRPLQRDVVSLTEHADFLSNKITFLLDAMLGLVGLAQNDIVKLFSVMAVVFLPPTLVASIYGMNFQAMPELNWTFGYPYALGLMLVSAIVPYLFFKWRRWL
ncbi:magnesium transporter CorA family protein [Methylopila henanensis]|uniref:Magnesium transporter CorA family protein n=1 Tax=Methylopila henanensis TaxID=873516 RepID=A0ABW4K5V8_9HYPH